MAETPTVAQRETGFPGDNADRGGTTGPGGKIIGFAGSPALAVLRVDADGVDAQTVTIGADIYELDRADDGVTAGRIAVTSQSDDTPAEITDALVLAINTLGTEPILAIDISDNEMLIMTADKPGGTPVPSTAVTALAETLAGALNAWDSAALRAGQAVAGRRFVTDTRVPNAQEVALGTMHIACPGFTPSGALVMVVITATGIATAWVGATLFAANRCTIDNTGAVDWAVTSTVFVIAWE